MTQIPFFIITHCLTKKKELKIHFQKGTVRAVKKSQTSLNGTQ